jgi:tetratricopeptide (TPR) repeat protein
MNTKKITDGIEWARTNWPSEGYFSISHVPTGYPFDPIDLFDENREELRSFLENALLQHPGDIAVRFTSIFIPFTCSHCYSEDELPDSSSSHEEYVRNEFRKLLSHFAGLLRVEDCTDWKRTQWEILNCYAAQNWTLSQELYNRAEHLQLIGRSDLLFLRAQFDFLLVFGREITADLRKPREYGADTINDLNLGLDSLLWPPILFPELMKDMRIGAPIWFVLLQWCLRLEGRDGRKSKEDIGLIIDAIRGFSQGINDRADLKNLYAPLLARSYFEKGEFITAAQWYEDIAKFVGTTAGLVADIRRLALEAAVRCYELAERFQEAVDVLEKCVREFPTQTGLHTRIAMLLTRMGRFEQVADSLRAEQERNPNIGEDWRDSTILALGSISPSSASLFYEQKPEVARGIDGVICGFWPGFGRLHPRTREYWVFGVYQANFHSEPQQGFSQRQAEVAVTFLAKAVEWELKTRLFSNWRDSVRQNAAFSAVNETPDTAIVVRFVRSPAPKITLGQMFQCLQRSDKSNDPFLSSLRSWTNNNCPNVLKSAVLNSLRELAPLSGDAKHTTVQQSDPLRAQELGQKVLDALAEV